MWKYLSELESQLAFLKLGDRLLVEIEGKPAIRPVGEPQVADEYWFAVHSILGAAANISKLLWGDSETTRVERAPLRCLLGVSEDSSFRWRHVRNKFEHVDEYIDEVLEADPETPLGGRGVGPASLVRTPEKVFGYLDTETGIVRFWSWQVSLRDLLTEGNLLWSRILSLELNE